MINEKGQAFDAFKLLIAAVVAGAILVIIIGILRPDQWFFTDPATEINNLIYQVKNTPGHGAPGNVVTFRVGETYTANGIASAAQLNKGSVFFCISDGTDTEKWPNIADGDKIDFPYGSEGNDACPVDFQFDNSATGIFKGSTKSSLTISEQISGHVRAYRASDTGSVIIFIGFKES